MDPHKVAWFRPNPMDEENAPVSAQETVPKPVVKIQQFVIHLTEEDVEDTRLRKLEQEKTMPALFPACLVPLTGNNERSCASG